VAFGLTSCPTRDSSGRAFDLASVRTGRASRSASIKFTTFCGRPSARWRGAGIPLLLFQHLDDGFFVMVDDGSKSAALYLRMCSASFNISGATFGPRLAKLSC
jgi:hypothetical protein